LAEKEKYLDRVVVLGESHLRRTLTAFVAYNHRERYRQALTIGSLYRRVSPRCVRTVTSSAARGRAVAVRDNLVRPIPLFK
jgi:hypothetical protein